MKTAGFWSAVFLATGTMIGVGLLALPIINGLLGFFPGLVLTMLAVIIMWMSGALMAERAMDLRITDGDITSQYTADLGRWVKWIIIPVYLLLFYAVLVAYLSAAAGILLSITARQIPITLLIMAAFAFCSLFMLFGHNMMLRFNRVIVSLMIFSFITMLLASMSHISAENLTHVNLTLAPFALPVLACAFAYHNVIPLICRRLDNERRSVHLALTFAVLIAFGLMAVWLLVVSGTLPYSAEDNAPSLLSAYRGGAPATVPLVQITGSRLVAACAVSFSLLAILTSYIGIGAALSSFIRDICAFLRPRNRAGLLFCAVFLPPLSLALLKPDVFLEMVDVAGGFGVIVLFGILPVLAFAKTRAHGNRLLQGVMFLMLCFFVFVFVIEMAKVLHLYKPDLY